MPPRLYRWVVLLDAPATMEELLHITRHKAKIISHLAVGTQWQLTVEQDEQDMSPDERIKYRRMMHTGTSSQ